MKKAEEYRAHATECRKLAASNNGDARETLLKMAETWESLAVDRERDLERKKRIKALETGE